MRKGERTRKATYPATAEAGIVRTHAQTIRIPTFQFTFFRPWESPTPRIAEVMTWVVLIGTPIAVAVRMTADDDVSALKPWTGCSSTKSLPTVLMMRHPPIAVPRAIAVAQAMITHNGMWKTGIAPKETRASEITPIDFCASFDPWEKAMNAAERICSFRKARLSGEG